MIEGRKSNALTAKVLSTAIALATFFGCTCTASVAYANPIAIFLAPTHMIGIALSTPIGILEGFIIAFFFKNPDKKFAKSFLSLSIAMTAANLVSSLVGFLLMPFFFSVTDFYSHALGSMALGITLLFIALFLLAAVIESPFVYRFHYNNNPKASLKALWVSMAANSASYIPFYILNLLD